MGMTKIARMLFVMVVLFLAPSCAVKSANGVLQQENSVIPIFIFGKTSVLQGRQTVHLLDDPMFQVSILGVVDPGTEGVSVKLGRLTSAAAEKFVLDNSLIKCNEYFLRSSVHDLDGAQFFHATFLRNGEVLSVSSFDRGSFVSAVAVVMKFEPDMDDHCLGISGTGD